MTKEEFNRVVKLFKDLEAIEKSLSLVKKIKENGAIGIYQSGDSVTFPEFITPEIKECVIQLLEQKLNKINTEIANV